MKKNTSDIVFVNALYGAPNGENSDINIPTGILSLASILRNNNYSVEVVDFNIIFKQNILDYQDSVDENMENMSDLIFCYKPKIVSFYTMCNSYHETIVIAKKLKEKNPNIKVLFGGPQASLTAKESMEKFSWIDCIGIGEGEKNILKIVDSFFTNKSLEGVKGIVYRDGDKIVYNYQQDMIENLDDLPYLDSSFLDLDNMEALPIEIGRGCPFGCTYCSTKTFWKRKFRMKSPDRILKEIKKAVNIYGINQFMFTHDIFTANKKQVIAICKKIIDSNINIKWFCHSRIDTLDEELMENLSAAGCKGIFFGIETGSQRMQKIINKNLDLDKVYEVMSLCKKYNMRVITSFIYGFPEEKIEDIRETIKMMMNLRKMKVDKVQLFALAILPGTEIFNKYRNDLVLSDDVSEISDSYSVKEYFNSIIKENIDIFPQYFKFDSDIISECNYLDVFINKIVPIISKYFSCAYEQVMDYYGNDVLALFLDFKNVNLSGFEKMKDNKLTRNEKSIFFDMLGEFVPWIEDKSGDKTIRDMFVFEKDIYEFMYVEKIERKIEKYNCNVYNIKKHKGLINEKDMDNVEIEFQRVNSKHIRLNCIQ